jgi:hypothetical protein
MASVRSAKGRALLPMEEAVYLAIEEAAMLVAQGRCVGTEARDAEGMPVGVMSARACTWCTTGALLRATHDEDANVLLVAIELVAGCAGVAEPDGGSARALQDWHDTAPDEKVVRAFRAAGWVAREKLRITTGTQRWRVGESRPRDLPVYNPRVIRKKAA